MAVLSFNPLKIETAILCHTDQPWLVDSKKSVILWRFAWHTVISNLHSIATCVSYFLSADCLLCNKVFTERSSYRYTLLITCVCACVLNFSIRGNGNVMLDEFLAVKPCAVTILMFKLHFRRYTATTEFICQAHCIRIASLLAIYDVCMQVAFSDEREQEQEKIILHSPIFMLL